MHTRPYHHGDLPATLLEAVDAIVREGGAGAVTLRGAARRAGVSHAAPAHHFGDKAGLLTAYAAQGFEALRTAMLAARRAAEARGAEPLLEIGLAYIRFAVAEPGRFSVMFRPEQVHADAPLYRNARDAAFAVLLEAVAGVRTDLEPDDPEVLFAATGAWSSVHGFATLWLDGSLADELTAVALDEAAQRMMTAFGATLFTLAGIPPGASPAPVLGPGTLEGGGVGQATASSSASADGAEESPDSTGQDAG
jgi:AcrR family transcriptional regulator